MSSQRALHVKRWNSTYFILDGLLELEAPRLVSVRMAPDFENDRLDVIQLDAEFLAEASNCVFNRRLILP